LSSHRVKEHDIREKEASNLHMPDFRLRLKSETSAAHDRVDAAYGALDITQRSDFSTFLQGQYLGHLSVQTALKDGKLSSGLQGRIEAIKQDLEKLGAIPRAASCIFVEKSDKTAQFHALGLTYVIAGSLHGTNVLRKLWKQSDDKSVLSANNFMHYAGLSREWSQVLAALKTKRFTPAQEIQIIRSANYAFSLFEAGLRKARTTN